MKTDIKFPCLVTCNTVQCIAINENHVVYLEGGYKGKVCIATTIYNEPDWSVSYEHKPEDDLFLYNSVKNAVERFKPDHPFVNSRTIEVNDIDFSPWKGDTKQFFDDVETLKRKQQTWKPTVGEQITMTFNGDIHCTGELLFVSDQYAIVRIGEKQEQHYHLGAWKITKPVTPESKLKDLWFECGQDIDLFITQVNKQYKE